MTIKASITVSSVAANIELSADESDVSRFLERLGCGNLELGVIQAATLVHNIRCFLDPYDYNEEEEEEERNVSDLPPPWGSEDIPLILLEDWVIKYCHSHHTNNNLNKQAFTQSHILYDVYLEWFGKEIHHYRKWIEDTGGNFPCTPMTHTAWGRGLAKLGIAKQKRSTGSYYALVLRDAPTTAFDYTLK